MTLKLETPRFGTLEIQKHEIISFPDGMLGFPDLKTYVLVDNPGGGPFKWIQSLEMPAIAFVAADPINFFPDYRISIRRDDLASIKLDDAADAYVLVVLTIRSNVVESTANLTGPVVINIKERLARQVVLNDPRYHTRHPLAAAPPPQGRGTTPAKEAGSEPNAGSDTSD